jgi:hypothetical protein
MSLTVDEATALKRGAATATIATATVKTWHCTTFPNCTEAANFLNLPPAQVAGEAFATEAANGTIILFYFL